MTGSVFFTEEVSNSKVAAICPSVAVARLQAARVREAMGLPASQVQVLTPGDTKPGRMLEPESHGIYRTMLWSHAKLGAMGALAGILAYAALRMQAVPMITQSPWLSLAALVFFGGIAGLMVGGLVTLRPDHDPYVMKVLGALREGDSAVVVHALSAEQKREAERILAQAGNETTSTL
jgi:hypothetical protein